VYGEPTFFAIESKTYKAGSFRAGGAYERVSLVVAWNVGHLISSKMTYSIDMVLENTGDGLSMLDILLCNQSQIGDLISVIGHKILQRALVVFSDLIRWEARHDENREDCSGQKGS